MRPLPVRPISGKFLVHVVGAEIQLLSLTVLDTGLGHEDLAVTFENRARENPVTFRADALGSAYEAADLFLLWL